MAGTPDVVHTFPWRGRRATVNSRWQTGYTLPTALTSARACRLADLELHADAGPAAGTVYAGVDVHNVSATPCAVQGTAQVALVAADGVVWQSNGPPVDPPSPAVVLTPNSWATTGGFAVAASCEGGNLTTGLRLGLPGQSDRRTLPLVVGRDGEDLCGADYGGHRPHPGKLAVTPFRPIVAPSGGGMFLGLTWLERSITVPGTVHRGQALHYTLTMEAPSPNQTGVDDQLCPIFQQQLWGVVPSVSYELNCDTLVLFNPGQAVVYRLELLVPADAAPGEHELRFQFLEPALPPMTAPVTVLP